MRPVTVGDAANYDEADQQRLARDLIEVHGNDAPTIARSNASAAALAGQPNVAKSWIRVLGIIQLQQAGQPGKA